jgi:tripartite-type tricarboxylate transporter receptor subunit TctC
MQRLRMTMIALTAAALVLGISTTLTAQANYPTRPMRLIVPFPPGGGNDILARAIGQRLAEVTGQAVVIENRAGAGGEIGATVVAQAAPDGYTMMLGSIGNLAHNPALKPNLSYNPVRDYAPVTLLATSAFIVVVNPSLPVKNIKELIALAKAKPGTINYCTPGQGSSFHMTTELFKYATGTDMVHVPYKGSAPALIELIAGQTQLSFSTMPPALPHVKTGKLRAIAVTSAKRAAVLPDLPTVSESGVPGFEVENWQGVVVPKQTPQAIVQKLNRDLITAMKRPGMVEVLSAQGLEAATTTTEAFGELIRSEIAQYTKVAKAANIKVD